MDRRSIGARASARILASAALAALAAPVHATGFFINQQSVRDLGRVGAGSAAAADGLGTIYFNPAGLTQLLRTQPGPQEPRPRSRFELGVHYIVPRSDLNDGGSTAATPGTLGAPVPSGGNDHSDPVQPTWVPNVYWAREVLEGRGAIGVGVNAPFGLKTSFPGDWFGRYDATRAALTTVNVGLVAGYDATPAVSIGGGLDLQYANSQLATSIPNPLVPGGPTPATDGRAETRGHDWSPGFNLGLLVRLSEDTRIGVHYRSGIKHTVRGSTTITGLTGPLAAFNGTVGASADLHLPAIGTVSVFHRLASDLKLLASLEWHDWSRFREVRIRFSDGSPEVVRPANYRDAFALALGAEYPVAPKWTARGGVRFDQTPTSDGFRDTTVPDADRTWLGLGASYAWKKNVVLDLAYNHVWFRTAKVAVTRTFFDGTPLASTATVNGTVKSSVNTFSAAVRCAF